ncbi:MAG: ABC transporter ATP-binding protein [Holophagae bacterium]
MIRIEGLSKRYRGAERDVLRGVDLTIGAGEVVSLIGRSGCGKTTLLNVVGGLDRDYEGCVEVAGHRLSALTDRQLARYRRRRVGFVFQAYHLLEHLTCAENVALSARFAGRGGDDRARALEVLDLVGLGRSADHRPTRLSGGERQRVAVARALFNGPDLLLLDEPTGNLDDATGAALLDLLSELHTELRVTIVAATHDAAIEAAGGRLLMMSDGVVTERTRRSE